MSKISAEYKLAIVQKVLLKDGRTLREIAKTHNIPCSTLSGWVKRCQNNDIIDSGSAAKATLNVSSPEKFQHLMAVASLDEVGIGVYCREHGLYSFQLTEWKEAFMAQPKTDKQQSNSIELKALRLENKQLKQEIRRKDSALAETAALLVLKKKASLIWEEPVDD
jgi:transposase-like protein